MFYSEEMITFASEYTNDSAAKGLNGFDSGMKWYVSTRSFGSRLLNISYQQINWRKQLRSRCLTEVQ